jgi:WD40 repeat protein
MYPCGNSIEITVMDILNSTQFYEGHVTPVTHLVYFSSAKILVSASADGCIKAWNVGNGATESTLLTGQMETIQTLKGYDRTNKLVVGTNEGNVVLYDVVSGKSTTVIKHERDITCVALNDKYVIGGSDVTLTSSSATTGMSIVIIY